MLHFAAEIQFFVKFSSVHVKGIFDDCAETFELNMEEIHTRIPKLMRKFEIVGKSLKMELQILKTQSRQQWTSEVVPDQNIFLCKSQN